jgi:hypothetical protein
MTLSTRRSPPAAPAPRKGAPAPRRASRGAYFELLFQLDHLGPLLTRALHYYENWYSGYYDPSTVTPDEQPTYPIAAYPYVRPHHSSCSTQTYKVSSEDGGETSVNVERC